MEVNTRHEKQAKKKKERKKSCCHVRDAHFVRGCSNNKQCYSRSRNGSWMETPHSTGWIENSSLLSFVTWVAEEVFSRGIKEDLKLVAYFIVWSILSDCTSLFKKKEAKKKVSFDQAFNCKQSIFGSACRQCFQILPFLVNMAILKWLNHFFLGNRSNNSQKIILAFSVLLANPGRPVATKQQQLKGI